MSAPSLSRHVFKTSRVAEFSSKKELVNQTGHAVEDWPVVVLKELLDNGLDACEEAGVAPAIEIVVSSAGIAVSDNASGIAPDTVSDILDFTSRVSSREAYVSPTRGAQGNAMKTLLGLPIGLDGQRGETVIESRGVAHRIRFSIDPIRQEPRIAHACEASLVKSGTRIALLWPDSACSILDDARDCFLRIAEDFVWVNPHLSLSVTWNRSGRDPIQWRVAATDPAWRKWRPSDPTSPHWYDEARLARLIANTIAYSEDHKEPCPTVWAFVRQFRGLSGTAKARDICETAGAARLSLADFYGEDGRGRVGGLLDAILSGASGRQARAWTPSSPSNAPAETSQLLRSFMSPAPDWNISTAASRASRFRGVARGEKGRDARRSARASR
jgi:hypothetical protein